MKKFLSLMLSFVMVLGMCSFASAEAIYTPGTYEASVNGMNGPVVVTMEFSESAILSVTAVGEKETKGLGDVAIDKLIPAILSMTFCVQCFPEIAFRSSAHFSEIIALSEPDSSPF